MSLYLFLYIKKKPSGETPRFFIWLVMNDAFKMLLNCVHVFGLVFQHRLFFILFV